MTIFLMDFNIMQHVCDNVVLSRCLGQPFLAIWKGVASVLVDLFSNVVLFCDQTEFIDYKYFHTVQCM